MLNIVVINCDDRYVEYEWTSKEAFIEDMKSDNENIPMLDDVLAEVNTQDDNLQLWWRNTDGLTVDDLLEECKQELYYIAIFKDKMIEVKVDSKRDAYNKAKRYFESREHRELFDSELKVCQIPSIIGVLDE